MTRVKPWRDLLEEDEVDCLEQRELTTGEQALIGKEPDLWEKTGTAARAYANKRNGRFDRSTNTWFFEYDRTVTPPAYAAVLGWNQLMVLRSRAYGEYVVEAVLLHAEDTIHFALGSTEHRMMHDSTRDGYAIYTPSSRLPVRRVTTSTASTCSVSVAYSDKPGGPLLMSHIDDRPPIPFGTALDWLGDHDKRNTNRLTGIKPTKLQSTKAACGSPMSSAR